MNPSLSSDSPVRLEPTVAVARSLHDRLRVVMFSGGSGTKSIANFLLRHPQVDLTVLVNCYDDGHSTGRLRRFIPGMLGPSDIRKNIAHMMPSDSAHTGLAALSDYRLARKAAFDPSMDLVRAMAELRVEPLPPEIAVHFEALSFRQARMVARCCQAFLDYQYVEAAFGRRFDFDDCAIGNIIFGGCYLDNGRDFNRAVAAACAAYDVKATLLNVTQGENLFLVAICEDSTLIRTEAEIVSRAATVRIGRITLIPEDCFRSRIEPPDVLSNADAVAAVLAEEVQPRINSRCEEALRDADVIIYGPGTQHSSLLPSYLTSGVAEAIASNRSADKVFIANIRRDHDIPLDSVNDLADKLLSCLGRGGSAEIQWEDMVSQFLVQDQRDKNEEGYIPFDQTSFRHRADTVRVGDWESESGGHSGGIVFEELRQIVQSRIEIALNPLPHLVSIVVPALNEQATVERVLRELVQLDLSSLGISKEIILVDGGSTDRTVELAKSIRGVKVLASAVRIGRGEALRRGIKQARGGQVLFYPSDGEYDPEDIPGILSQLLSGRFEAVFGTRNLVILDLKSHLKSVYAESAGLSLLSRYGGMLISILTLLLYDRYITDTLTGLKAFDAAVLRNLHLKSAGVDLEMEIVAKLSRQRRFILEVPIRFKARTRAQGKKMTVADGFRALLALLRFRITS
jgi:2-phospho-L-lactate transferase/gluconeogenesis factor (CofD/UPF0052 family)